MPMVPNNFQLLTDIQESLNTPIQAQARDVVTSLRFLVAGVVQ